MIYINFSEINSKVKEILGDEERYNIDFSMAVSEEITGQQKPTFQPFYHVTSDTQDVQRGIKTLALNNLGASSSIITSIKDKLEKIKNQVGISLAVNSAVFFVTGGGIFRKKFVSFEVICSLKRIKSILSNRNFSIIINAKVTKM